jgi:hypothetical protein
MRLKHLLLIPVAAAAMTTAAIGPATAGERNGNYDPTGAMTNSNSECSFSGLQDGDENDDGVPDVGAEYGPGTPPQNWGHISKADRAFLTSVGANPGMSCNGHLSPRK